MDTIDFSSIVETLKQAKTKAFKKIASSGSLDPEMINKLSMLNLYCDTASSNVDAAKNAYEEIMAPKEEEMDNME